MGYELEETLYEPVEKDGTTVPEGDPRARFLVGVAGATIPDEEAERLGLTKRKGAPATREGAASDADAGSAPAEVDGPGAKQVRLGDAAATKAERGPEGAKGRER